MQNNATSGMTMSQRIQAQQVSRAD
jgi:hypothetical protein